MEFRFSYSGKKTRIAILVSRYDHCLLDLLGRWRRGELAADIVGIISNHPDLRPEVEAHGLNFYYVPMEPGRKRQAEEIILGILHGRVDLVVLAQYMQILSGSFLEKINIHHSFLPAFTGADPYRAALTRGVKIIGATAHYATEELDAGLIIEQDVERVTHRHTLAALERIGRDIERVVLARAVSWHVEDRVVAHDNRTFVFA